MMNDEELNERFICSYTDIVQHTAVHTCSVYSVYLLILLLMYVLCV